VDSSADITTPQFTGRFVAGLRPASTESEALAAFPVTIEVSFPLAPAVARVVLEPQFTGHFVAGLRPASTESEALAAFPVTIEVSFPLAPAVARVVLTSVSLKKIRRG
jgi:hypothetical protein